MGFRINRGMTFKYLQKKEEFQITQNNNVL